MLPPFAAAMAVRRATVRQGGAYLYDDTGVQWRVLSAVAHSGHSQGFVLCSSDAPSTHLWAKRVPQHRSQWLMQEAQAMWHAGSLLRPAVMLHTSRYAFLLMPKMLGNAFLLRREAVRSYVAPIRKQAAIGAVCRCMLLTCLCELSRLHARQIAHQDIKPEHLLFNLDGDVVLADYSSAQVGSAAAPLRSTLGYLAPEAFVCEQPERTSLDVFALGASVLSMVCGASPFLFEAAQAYAAHRDSPDGQHTVHAQRLATSLVRYGQTYENMLAFAAAAPRQKSGIAYALGEPAWARALQRAADCDRPLLRVLLSMLAPCAAQRPSAAELLVLCQREQLHRQPRGRLRALALRAYARQKAGQPN